MTGQVIARDPGRTTIGGGPGARRILNVETLRALGLTIPPSMVRLVTKWIE